MAANPSSHDQDGYCLDWFDAGAAVMEGQRDAHLYPPLDEREVQRQWLGGFGAAWAELDDGRDVEDALMDALGDRQALLTQLWAIGLGRVERSIH